MDRGFAYISSDDYETHSSSQGYLTTRPRCRRYHEDRPIATITDQNALAEGSHLVATGRDFEWWSGSVYEIECLGKETIKGKGEGGDQRIEVNSWSIGYRKREEDATVYLYWTSHGREEPVSLIATFPLIRMRS